MMDPNSINPHEVELREQDRWLPIANVARLMKNTLPATAKVSKDAKECMQECVSEFISFITSEASDKCLKEKRKTINGEDILYSMHDLGFENYAEVLKIYLAKYREQQALKQERNETKASKRQKKATPMTETVSHPDTNTQDESPSSSPLHEEFHNRQEGVAQHHQGEQRPDLNLHESNNINGVIASAGSSASSIGSPESFLNQYDSNETGHQEDNGHLEHDKEIKEEGIEGNGGPVHKDEGYRYDDFINDPGEEHIGNHQHIDELTKQLTNDEPDIDTLAASIAHPNPNGYF